MYNWDEEYETNQEILMNSEKLLLVSDQKQWNNAKI